MNHKSLESGVRGLESKNDRDFALLGAWSIVSFVLFGFLVVQSGANPAEGKPASREPPTPEEIRRRLQIEPGLRVELVAAEPQIESPVAMAFDEDGKLWVVEMLDYPSGPAKGRPPEGRIKVLEDRDGDGRFETARVFADQLLFANGLLPWKGGMIVTAAPHILYLKDTDGDGMADLREVWFEGFATANPQLRVSHPLLGLDGWVYVVNGLRGGKIKRVGGRQGKAAETPMLDVSGMDFRFNPLNPDQYEAISGMGQFGQTFDDWGRRFVCDNNHHLRHVVLENRYIKRNPYLAVPAVLQDTSVLDAGPLSSGGRIFPISKNWTTSSLHEGRFTAACGVFIYRGSLLPKQHYGTAFTCDPTGNLIHQEILTPHGATFKSKPAREGVEFLASPDDWFRPVFLSHGPDGAMYVVDMCRAVIEHPEFMPNELKNRPDMLGGKHHGRIWRILPEEAHAKAQGSQRKTLSKASTEELVKSLEHPDAWWRTTAQRLLMERPDKGAVEPLRKLASESKDARGRVHSAWVLLSLGQLDAPSVRSLFAHADPRVREQAALLAELSLADPRWLSKPGLLNGILDVAVLNEQLWKLADDDDPRVRFQVALTLGQLRQPEQLASIALRDADDRWTRMAVAATGQPVCEQVTLMKLMIGSREDPAPGRLLLIHELATSVGARRDEGATGGLLFVLHEPSFPRPVKIALVSGFAQGVERRGTRFRTFLESLKPIPTKSPLLIQPLQDVDRLLAEVSTLAGDPKAAPSERLQAVALLAHASWETTEPAVGKLMQDASQDLRLAAIRALSAHQRPEVPELLMKNWKAHTPPVRQAVLEAMLRHPDRVEYLLKEIEKGNVKPGDLDAARTRQLTNHSRPEIRDKARKLLQENLPEERKQVLAKYQDALKLKGDPKRGKLVFEKSCATCHRVAGIGVDVGPPIGDFERTRTAEQLLTDILNPNQAIDANYVNYVVHTKDQRVLTGAIAAETASSVTLRRAENQTDTVLRQDIDVIQSTGQSLMPEGLEKDISVQQLADLIDFLKNWRYLTGVSGVPGK